MNGECLLVIPAQAGIQDCGSYLLDSRLRGNDVRHYVNSSHPFDTLGHMLAKLHTFSLLGIDALPVEIEVDV